MALHDLHYISAFVYYGSQIVVVVERECSKPAENQQTLGLAFVLMLRPFFPELVMSTDLLSFEHPSVLLFSFNIEPPTGNASPGTKHTK